MGCNCCKPLDLVMEEEVESYARGIKIEHLRGSILYYEWACEKWKEAALRIACIRALEEARGVTYENRVKFLNNIPRKVLLNESFQDSLRYEWVETYIEGNELRSVHDENSLNTALESIGF